MNKLKSYTMSSQLLFLCVCYGLAVMARCNILVYRAMSNQFVQEIDDLYARFGPSIPARGLRVRAVRSNDTFGCGPLNLPPSTPGTDTKFAVILQRGGNCNFEQKVRNAQASMWNAVIVYNTNNDEDLVPMSAQNPSGISIPAVFVGFSDGVNLITAHTDDTYILVINYHPPYDNNI